MQIENDIADLMSKLKGLHNKAKIKAIVSYVNGVIKEKDGELDEFAMSKASDVKFKTEEFIDDLIADYHQKELMSDSNNMSISLKELFEDLRWLNNQIKEIK